MTSVQKIAVCCLALFMAVLLGSSAHAVPAAPVVYTLSQPDGSMFEARQWGDEWLHGWETVEGHSIVFDEYLKGWAFAVSDTEGALFSSSKVVGKDPAPEASKYLRPKGQARSTSPVKRHSKESSLQTTPQEIVPPIGIANVPVILVNFSDRTTAYTPAQFNTLLFGTGNNSMKDYYQEVSYGTFSVSPGPAGIMGWYKASNTHDYYGSNVLGDDAWPGDLVYEAVVAADATVNFASYDQDGDCYVDVVAIVHQGSGEEESGASTDIWSHRWSLSGALYWGRSHSGAYTTNDPCTANPSQFVIVNDYIIQPERDSSGTLQTIGVFAHEYGHALGLPDLYDTDYSSRGIGRWSLMAGGSWNYVTLPGDRPAHMDAWSKYKLGWVTPMQVTGTLTNEPIQQAATAADVYKLLLGSATPPSGEYFLVENRQKSGFDAGLPGAGLLIWHIDESKTTNTQECPGGPPCSNHYKVALVQADNLWDLESNTDSGDTGDPYPGSANNTSFTACTSPNSDLYSGTAGSVSITNISGSGPTMTATLSISGPVTCGGGEAAYTINPSASYSYITANSQISSWAGTMDDGYFDLSLAGFDFQFYRTPVTNLRISTNGYITFGTAGTDYSNDPIPNVNLPNAIIAPFWNDLNLTGLIGERGVWWGLLGTSPSRQLIIEWRQVPGYRYPTSAYSFEIILYESSDRIKFQYLDIDSGTPYDFGASATVGIENFDGTAGSQFSYNTASLSNGKAIEFIPRQPGIVDFDGDGLSDLAGITSGGSIFYTTDLQTWTKIPGVLSQLVVGDFNADGQSDLAGLALNGSIWVTTDLLTWVNIPGLLNELVVGDFNGDGNDDLAGLAPDGSIWFTTNLSTWTNIPGTLAKLVSGDLNPARIGDELAGLALNGSIWVTTDLLTWVNIPGLLNELVVGDFNGDGNDDLAGLASNGSIWFTTNLSAWTNVPGTLAKLVSGDFNLARIGNELAGLALNGSILVTTDLLTWVNVPGVFSQLVVGNFGGDGTSDLAGLTSAGTIFYTTDRSTWTQIPGVLSELAE